MDSLVTSDEKFTTEEQQLDTLQTKLASLPASMVIFSDALRSLYTVHQVTGLDKSTKMFLEVRNNTRQNAIVYTTTLLPMTEQVIRAIGFFADYFNDLDFDDWSDSLEDIILDVDRAQGVCDILKQMHNSIIIELKKNESKAKVSVEQMEMMARQYKEEEENLKKKAEELKQSADDKRDKAWTGIFCFGISTLILNAYAAGDDDAAQANIATAVAKSENANITRNAVCLTTTHLIPAVMAFIDGLEVCSMFLSDTRERLAKMKNAGDKGPKKPYYKMMKKRASELSSNSLRFLAVTDMMRNNLAAIPAEPQDKNYVDTWFDQQKEQFQKEHKSTWERIKGEVARIASKSEMKMLKI